MNVYMAAVFWNNYYAGQTLHEQCNEIEKGVFNNIPYLLESYHYLNKPRIIGEVRQSGRKVFLDSGAFSAWSLGVKINLPNYCEYIKRNADFIAVEDGALMASVLDGIGDPLQTYRNQLSMEEYGVRPLPCFHFGEDPRYLDYYVSNYPYITIGGMVGKSKRDLIPWLDRMWGNHMIDSSGRPRLKVHAFGVTSVELMELYPWHSVDSSSWIQAASFGNIYTDQFGPIQISSKSPSRHELGRHFATLTDIEREEVRRVLEADGFTPERLAESYQSRAAGCILGFQQVAKRINSDGKRDRFYRCPQDLFS